MTLRNKTRTHFLIAFLLLLTAECTQARKVEGYFITNRNDTVKTYFYSPNLFSYGVLYLDSTNKRKWLSPDVAKEIDFRYKNQSIKIVSKEYQTTYIAFRGRHVTLSHIFIEIIDDAGYMKLYFYSTREQQEGVFQKKNDNLFFAHIFSDFRSHYREEERKGLVQYFSDCPDVEEKFKDKKVKSYTNVVNLVKESTGLSGD